MPSPIPLVEPVTTAVLLASMFPPLKCQEPRRIFVLLIDSCMSWRTTGHDSAGDEIRETFTRLSRAVVHSVSLSLGQGAELGEDRAWTQAYRLLRIRAARHGEFRGRSDATA